MGLAKFRIAILAAVVGAVGLAASNAAVVASAPASFTFGAGGDMGAGKGAAATLANIGTDMFKKMMQDATKELQTVW